MLEELELTLLEGWLDELEELLEEAWLIELTWLLEALLEVDWLELFSSLEVEVLMLVVVIEDVVSSLEDEEVSPLGIIELLKELLFKIELEAIFLEQDAINRAVTIDRIRNKGFFFI